jgi:hypothetical protein
MSEYLFLHMVCLRTLFLLLDVENGAGSWMPEWATLQRARQMIDSAMKTGVLIALKTCAALQLSDAKRVLKRVCCLFPEFRTVG